MERCDELLWPETECGKAIGPWQLVHDICVDNGVTLAAWHPRIRMAFPYLCRHDCELVANWMTAVP